MDETGGNLSFALSYNVGRGGEKNVCFSPFLFSRSSALHGSGGRGSNRACKVKQICPHFFPDHHQAGPFPLSPPRRPLLCQTIISPLRFRTTLDILQKIFLFMSSKKTVSASSTKNRGKRSSSKEPSLCSKKRGKGMTQEALSLRLGRRRRQRRYGGVSLFLT